MRCWLVGLAVLVVATAARADQREDARREFTAGQAADTDRDYQSAIEHYLRANDLVSHPFTMFNIAVDYERLGKLREAVAWYVKYAGVVGDPAERNKTLRLIDDIKQRPSKVEIRSAPLGGRVLVDGTAVGHTPYTATMRGGVHRVSVELDGQHDDKELTIEYGEPVDVTFTLRGATGQLMVAGTPVGALVTIDDQPAGAMPSTLTLPPGQHHVHVTSVGFAPWDSDFTVEPNRTTKVDVTMVKGLDGGIEPPRVIQLQYLVGATGGADARGSGAMGLFEFGVRYQQYAALLQLGKANGTGFFGILARWSMFPGRLSPYIGLGYVGTSDTSGGSGSGFEVEGGLHYDIAKSDKGSFAAVVSAGVYYYGTTDMMTGSSSLAVAVPISLSLEASFGK